ncbi:DIEXF [Bugula neritina]|uniref:U3 small nucleolar RNA-associated protein 25 homolog n=1 Tax=Bugula neritina TaxID=10212 RepID=A0A7J7KEV9_BUGNE|nr:DIEXF [Bugula neritina]
MEVELRNLLFKMRGKNKQKGFLKMSKRPPKQSRDAEEMESMSLFDNSIPSGSRSSKVARVFDKEDPVVQSDDESEEDSFDNQPDGKEQLLAALGVKAARDTSDDESSSDSEVQESVTSLEDVTDSEASAVEEENVNGDEDDLSTEEVLNSESKPDPSRKRVLSDGEEVEELSLAESSSAEDSSEDVPQSKKLKPLDLAVYPDDVLPVEPVKTKVVVKETIKPDDSFSTHFEQELDETKLLSLADKKQWTAKRVEVVGLGRGMHRYPPTCDSTELNDPTATLPSVGLRSRLFNHVGKTLKQHCGVQQTGDAEPALSRPQRSMFDIINQYKDLYNPAVTNEHLEQFRMVYCLHSLNHILKTRLTVTNNSEEKRANELKKKAMDKEYRDQGLTRPKVLILTPFKECARRIVNMFESLLMSKKKIPFNLAQFHFKPEKVLSEFSPEEDSGIDPKKPDDYVKLFDGNTDDCFRLGVQLSKSGMKLYVDFYKADILLCSPLGLRLILGADGDLKRDYDFMSSIEVLILDQADVFLMQNWEHLLHTMRLLHVQPKESRGTDYSRVRMWTLDGHAKHYRQTIVQSCVHCPEVAAIFTKHCASKLLLSLTYIVVIATASLD